MKSMTLFDLFRNLNMVVIRQFILIWLAAMTAASCAQLSGKNYIGHYEIQCKTNSEGTLSEVRTVAQRVADGLALKFDEISNDNLSFSMVIRQAEINGISRPGLVFYFSSVPGDSWGITIAKDGREEDAGIRNIRRQIEAALNDAVPARWSYRVTSWSAAKP